MISENKLIKGLPRPRGNFPHAKRVGDFVFVSGTSARRADDTIEGAELDEFGVMQLDVGLQTQATIKTIEIILNEFGADLSNIVEISSFLVNMDHFDKYNEAYGKFFDYDGPTRTTVAVYQLPHPYLLIEIKAIAYKPI
jgi:2-aminomuconate deaminase